MDYQQKAEFALKDYLDLGIEAIRLLNSDDLEKALHVLRLRTLAFHKFQAADRLRDQSVPTSYDDHKWGFLDKIESIEKDLYPLLERCRTRLDLQNRSLQSNLKNLGKFRSGGAESMKFEKKV